MQKTGPSIGSMPIVYLGPPKSATTTFHDIMKHLGLHSMHIGGPGTMDVLTHATPSLADAFADDDRSCARSGRTALGPLPMSRVAKLVGHAAIACMLTASGYHAFADDPWPLLYATIDALVPSTRFVLWARPSDDWARSFVRFFAPLTPKKSRWLRLSYGVCNITKASEPLLSRVMREHVARVRAYFASGPARAARLLLIDNLDAADAQAELCAFALGVANVSSHPRCRALLSKPMQRTLPPETSGKPPWSLRYNAPLGPAWEIPAWRGCVRRANHSGLMHK